MLTDKRTIRTAILKRVPEIFYIDVQPRKEHIHLGCVARINNTLTGKPYFIVLEEDGLSYQDSHNSLMNCVDRIYDEVQKYKKGQKEIKEFADEALHKLGAKEESFMDAVKDAKKQLKVDDLVPKEEPKLDPMQPLTNEKAEDERTKKKKEIKKWIKLDGLKIANDGKQKLEEIKNA